MHKTILIAGITGFIGKALADRLLKANYRVKGLTRSPEKAGILKYRGIEPLLWDDISPSGWKTQLTTVDAVIDLTGENIAASRWSKKKKQKILNSRIQSGHFLSQAIKETGAKPSVYIQASAIGFYGNRGDSQLNENSPAGENFLAQVVKQWEASSSQVESLNLRRVICRFGMVLGKDGGALKPMITPFRWFLGGALASGQQWISWIHLEDVVNALEFIIDTPGCRGIYNCTAPEPVKNREMARTIGQILHRPSLFTVPAWILKLWLGEMAEELLLSSQRVFPHRLLEAGFVFQFPNLKGALKELFS